MTGLTDRKKPNFFIIGAPKCGTTSLARWLETHPRVFLPPRRKEPHFFSGISPDLKRRKQYERLYKPASAAHTTRIDASTSYLDHPDALQAVRAYSPEARYVVILRNPVEMAYSLHGQQRWGGSETEPDFETAWRLQTERWESAPPRKRQWAYSLQYYQRCRLGLHLQRALEILPEERFLILFLEDIARDPRAAYLRVLEFAGLADDGRTAFPRENPAKLHRYPRISRVIGRLGRLRMRLGISRGFGIHRRFSQLTGQRYQRPRLRPDFERELYAVFAEEIDRLETRTGRDLSHWKHPMARASTAAE